MSQYTPTPMDKIESLAEELVAHYGEGDERELRVAAKMLLVSLNLFRQYGGAGWPNLVREYLSIAIEDPEKFSRILVANRSGKVPLISDATH